MKSVKKIYYIIFIGLFVLYIGLTVFTVYNINNFTDANNSDFNDLNIIIDPGHGGEDGGAVANGIIEKNINLSIAKKLINLFKSSGFNVTATRNSDTMINSDGNTIGSKKVSDMKNRLEMYNKADNNVVISIHQNKFTQEKYSGTQVFYSQNNELSKILAESVKDSIKTLIQPDNTRECKCAGKEIYLLNNSTVPSIIVECGFISNFEEANKLKEDYYQKQLAYGIYIGFLEYYNR